MSDFSHEDPSFFENLFRQYYKTLKACAHKFVNDVDAAEDIVQDVFFELWKKHEKLESILNFKQYLLKAVSNRSINYLKTKKKEIPLENFQLDILLHSHENFEEYPEHKEIDNHIKQCVDALPDQCKRIFILRHTYDLRNREIAQQFDISLKAVEKQISKAVLRIRTHLIRSGLLALFSGMF